MLYTNKEIERVEKEISNLKYEVDYWTKNMNVSNSNARLDFTFKRYQNSVANLIEMLAYQRSILNLK